MTTNDKTGGPAYPVTPIDGAGRVGPNEFGMTLLDYFAAHVAQGMAASDFWAWNCDGGEGNKSARKAFCQSVFAVAQDLLAERERVMKELNQ